MKQGWALKRLDQVCTFINGRAYKKNELLHGGKYPVLRVGNFFTNNHWYHSDLELPDDKYCDTGDLLYAWSASFGPKIWTGEKVIYHYHIWKVIPDYALISKEFLYLLLDWDTDKIKEDQGTGTTMMHVGKGSMDARMVPIPPLPEQQRIVAILDEAFAAIAQAKANAEQNLKNAKELFESYLQSVFENKGDDWEEKTLGELCELISGQHIDAKDYNFSNQGIGYLTGPSDFGPLNPVITKWTEKPKIKAQSGDILITVKGSGVGKVNILNQNEIAISRQLMAIRVTKASKAFIYAILSVKNEYFKELSTGAAIPGISRLQVLGLPIFIPSLSEQQTIVQKLDALSAETKQLEAIYQQKINDLDELKKSILQKAFAGELNTTALVA